MTILNLTQHAGTKEQCVTEPSNKEQVKELLTFKSIPTPSEIKVRAEKLAEIAAEPLQIPVYEWNEIDCANDCVGFTSKKPEKAMIAGVPCLMRPLEEALQNRGIRPVYAFSERISVEVEQADGSVRKTNVFKHIGFVEA